jgi:hypothetical protein
LPGNDRNAVPFADRKRRRSLLRRLFYREDPFLMLDAAELDALYQAFACVVRLHPVVLYWIHRLNDQEYFVSSFQHRSMAGYSGLEVVHVTPDEVGYYRLPGAKVGGRGRTQPGVYSIFIQAPGREKHYLRIRKCEFGQLHLDEVCAPAAQDAQSFLTLKRYVLERSKFADEMRMIVERGIEWDYQRALLGEPELFQDAEWNEMREKCEGISRKADALLRARAELRRTRR